jgi:hypothetical protein
MPDNIGLQREIVVRSRASAMGHYETLSFALCLILSQREASKLLQDLNRNSDKWVRNIGLWKMVYIKVKRRLYILGDEWNRGIETICAALFHVPIIAVNKRLQGIALENHLRNQTNRG